MNPRRRYILLLRTGLLWRAILPSMPALCIGIGPGAPPSWPGLPFGIATPFAFLLPLFIILPAMGASFKMSNV